MAVLRAACLVDDQEGQGEGAWNRAELSSFGRRFIGWSSGRLRGPSTGTRGRKIEVVPSAIADLRKSLMM